MADNPNLSKTLGKISELFEKKKNIIQESKIMEKPCPDIKVPSNNLESEETQNNILKEKIQKIKMKQENQEKKKKKEIKKEKSEK